jgi:hypothetical protein
MVRTAWVKAHNIAAKIFVRQRTVNASFRADGELSQAWHKASDWPG